MSLCIFTVVARNYLPLAYTLADSVHRQHPEADLRIFVADGTAGLPDGTPRHGLTGLDTYLGAEFDELRFKYNVTEFCTAVKPQLMLRLLSETNAEFVYYLDPDTWLFDRLDTVHATAPTANVYLTPHLLHCQIEPAQAYPEYKHLWEGIFNLGFCGVRRGGRTEHFLAWWARRLQDHCFADHFDGLHTDQKWLDYAPVYLGDALHVVRHPGVNTAHWNLDERELTRADDGWRVSGVPLVLFHFSGFDFRGQGLTRHVDAEHQHRYATAALERLVLAYRQAVFANGYDAHIGLPYRYGSYDNGQAVTSLHRRLYRALGGAVWASNPFSSNGALYAQLVQAGLLDNSAAAARDHAATTLPSVGRLTRIARFVLKQFLRLCGPTRYAYLLKFFYKFARPEEHVFLLAAAAAAKTAER